MFNRTIGFLISGMGALLVSGCDSGTPATVAPTISIISPSGGASVSLGTDSQLSLPVTFKTTNFLLMTANSPGCGVGCGHVDLLVDGSACNSPPAANNDSGAASPIDARFASCATPSGNH